MTLTTLLSKELRSYLRRESTIWTIILYVGLLGLICWLGLRTIDTYNGESGLSQAGAQIYVLLTQLELLLIIMITPAFAARTINTEKEQQTYDILLCSHLTPSTLFMGKLLAGLCASLLFIVAALPLFSLVLFFGGVSLTQMLKTLLVFLATILVVNMVGFFTSSIFKRSWASLLTTYLFGFLWVLLPIILYTLFLSIPQGSQIIQNYPSHAQIFFLWNPLAALISTYPTHDFGYLNPWLYFMSWIGGTNSGILSGSAGSLLNNNWRLTGWSMYSLISCSISLLLGLNSTHSLQNEPPLTHTSSLQNEPPLTHTSSSQNEPPLTHTSSSQNEPPLTHTSSSQKVHTEE